jgi:hypothetical protein
MPDAAPVMMATLPCKRCMECLLWGTPEMRTQMTLRSADAERADSFSIICANLRSISEISVLLGLG